MTTATTTSTISKLCHFCSQDRPLSDFRRRRKGGEAREARCRSCFSLYMKQWRAARRTKSLAKFSAEVRRARGPRQVEQLCDAMVQRCGGVARLAEAWSQQYHAALTLQPGSRAATNMVLALCRLMELRDAQNPEPDLSDWTDAELDAEVERMMNQSNGPLSMGPAQTKSR